MGECAQPDTRKVSRLRSPERMSASTSGVRKMAAIPLGGHQKDHAQAKAETGRLDKDFPKDKPPPGDVGKADRYAHRAERCRTARRPRQRTFAQRNTWGESIAAEAPCSKPASNKNLMFGATPQMNDVSVMLQRPP